MQEEWKWQKMGCRRLTEDTEDDRLHSESSSGNYKNGRCGQVEEDQALDPRLTPVNLGIGFDIQVPMLG